MIKNKITKIRTTALGLGIALLIIPLSVQAEPFAYVPDSDGTVSVIDTATNLEIANIPSNSSDVETGRNGKTLYMTRWNISEVLVYDAATYTLQNTIPITGYPMDLAVSYSANKVFICGRNGYVDPGSIGVIDMATNTQVASIPVDPSPVNIVVNHDGSRAYVYYLRGTKISVIDTATNTVITDITLDAEGADGSYAYAKDLIASPSTHYVYALSHGVTKYIHVIDTNTNTVINRYEAPGMIHYLAVTPDNSKLYASTLSPSDFTVYVLSPLTGAPITNFNAGARIGSMKIHPNGVKLYIHTTYHNGEAFVSQLRVVDTATDTVSEVIDPIGMSITGHMTVSPIPEYVAGSASGLDQLNVVCTNLTTAQQVTIPLLPGNSWDCEKEGLVVNAGDNVDMSIDGNVK